MFKHYFLTMSVSKYNLEATASSHFYFWNAMKFLKCLHPAQKRTSSIARHSCKAWLSQKKD